MQIRKHLWLRTLYIALVGILVLGVAELLFAITDTRTAAERAKAWAVSNEASLPMTLEEIAAFPREYREAIRESLPADVRSTLWRSQFRRFLDDNPNLTEEQRAFVERQIQQFTPENIERANAEKDTTVFDICERGPELFPDRELMQVFNILGWNAAPQASWSSTVAATRSRLGSAVGLLSLNPPMPLPPNFATATAGAFASAMGARRAMMRVPRALPPTNAAAAKIPAGVTTFASRTRHHRPSAREA